MRLLWQKEPGWDGHSPLASWVLGLPGGTSTSSYVTALDAAPFCKLVSQTSVFLPSPLAQSCCCSQSALPAPQGSWSLLVVSSSSDKSPSIPAGNRKPSLPWRLWVIWDISHRDPFVSMPRVAAALEANRPIQRLSARWMSPARTLVPPVPSTSPRAAGTEGTRGSTS